MIGLREDQRERGELVAMIKALLPAPCRRRSGRRLSGQHRRPLTDFGVPGG